MKIEANASKREQRPLVDYAEREHFRASEAWSIENCSSPKIGEVVEDRRGMLTVDGRRLTVDVKKRKVCGKCKAASE